MSRRVLRYEGEGRARRPVYADEGPSAASSGDGLASLSRLTALDARPTEIDRSVERRQISAAELAARTRSLEARPDHLRERAPDPRPSPFLGAAIEGRALADHHVSNAERMATSRHRGGQVNRARVKATAPTEEDPVPDGPADIHEIIPERDTVDDALGELQTAIDDARRAWGDRQDARAAADRAEATWLEAHDRLKSLLAGVGLVPAPFEPPPGMRAALVPAPQPAPAEPAPEPVIAAPEPTPADLTPSRQAGGGSGHSGPPTAADPRRGRQAPRRPQGRGRGARDQRQQRHDGAPLARPEGHPAARADRGAAGGLREVLGRLT